jgi:hypothetical protein
MAEKKPSNYDEVVDEKVRKLANEAYKNASKIGPDKPEPAAYTTRDRKVSQMPDSRESVRERGFTNRMVTEKKEAIDQGLKGAKNLMKPLAVASAMGPGAAVAMPEGTFKGPADEIMSAADKYRGARNALQSADREMEAQDRRESRMAKGGMTKSYAKGGSASSRADGIATKGKTRGKMC